MSIDPLSYVALKFAAPVAPTAASQWFTVTTIFHHATPDVTKVVSYRCQNCGRTLGAPHPRGGRNHVHRSPVTTTSGEVESPAEARGFRRGLRVRGWGLNPVRVDNAD
jgi:ribosomal protein S27E